jgi:ABC-2 type transport system permease protein
MTAATLAGPSTRSFPVRPVSFPRVVTSEWIKLRSLRSTWWTLALTVVVMAGIPTLVAWGMSQGVEGEGSPTMRLPALMTTGAGMAELTVAVLGVLIITGEYTTGQVRSSFAAVPGRIPVLAAKGLVLAVAVALTSLVGLAAAWLSTLAWHDRLDASLDLGNSEDLRILLGFPLFLATAGLLALAIGALLRRTPGALATVLGLMLVVETVFQLVPLRFFELVRPFLPFSAGGRLVSNQETIDNLNSVPDIAHLTAWQGYGVMAAWVVVLLVAAGVLLRRRDA